MDSKPKPVYEDLEVHTEWVHETADDILIAYLPGFRNEQLKVQVTTRGNLRISGERPIGDNKFNRFSKAIPIPSNCDQNKIRANYKGGMLRVKFPKLIVSAEEKPGNAKPSAVDPIPKSDQRHADVPEKQNNGVEQAVREAPPKAKEANKVPEQTPDKQKDMEAKSNASNETERLTEDKNGLDRKEKSSGKREKPADSAQHAATQKADIHYHQLGINYKRVLEGLTNGVKDPRKVTNIVLAVLLVVVLAVYLRNAITSLANY